MQLGELRQQSGHQFFLVPADNVDGRGAGHLGGTVGDGGDAEHRQEDASAAGPRGRR